MRILRGTRHLLLALCVPAFLLCHPARSQVVIIANLQVAASDISSADLRDLFTGASTSLKATPHIEPILLREGPAHEQMLSLYLGKSDSALRATWRSLVFSGQAVMPRSVENEALLIELVTRTPGGIGYIGKATPHAGVKVLRIR